MNFHDLRSIVNQIKKTMKCLKCNGKYSDIDIDVIGSLGNEQIFFHAFCPECDAESVIHVNMELEYCCLEHAAEMRKSLAHPGKVRLGSAPRIEHISTNEVLDMHNFLKGFNGNFSDMFKKEDKTF